MATLTEGARRLDDFIRQRRAQGLTQAKVAEALDVTPPAVHDWRTGRRIPERDFQDALEVFTHGEVRPEHWRDPDEERPVDRVQPFSPTPKAA